MQWNVQKVGGQAESHGPQGSRDMQVGRPDWVKGYHTSQASAIAEAKDLAAKHPGSQYAVFGILSIWETTKPAFVEKVLNDAGEVVVKPAATV